MITTKKAREKILQEIDQALEELRPHLAADGGDVEVIDITDQQDVQIKWLGNCDGCSMSTFTLKAGIEQVIKSKFPEINSVVVING
ncbi:MAG: NifU family protein [Saprospiraceae bacterium]